LLRWHFCELGIVLFKYRWTMIIIRFVKEWEHWLKYSLLLPLAQVIMRVDLSRNLICFWLILLLKASPQTILFKWLLNFNGYYLLQMVVSITPIRKWILKRLKRMFRLKIWLLLSGVDFVHIAILLDNFEYFDIINGGVNVILVINAVYFWSFARAA